MARITDKYKQWCGEAGWQPAPDQIVYRGSILLTETDRQADEWLERLMSQGLSRGLTLGPTVTQAVQAARAGKQFDLRSVVTNRPQANQGRDARGLMSFIGSPDTVVKQLKEFHDQSGVGVVDFAFQQTGISHQEVLQELELFGKEVLPRMQEF